MDRLFHQIGADIDRRRHGLCQFHCAPLVITETGGLAGDQNHASSVIRLSGDLTHHLRVRDQREEHGTADSASRSLILSGSSVLPRLA